MKRATAEYGERTVPFPDERPALIEYAHERSGHFGTRKTESLLVKHYTWAGMRKDVEDFCENCRPCQKVRAKFDAEEPMRSVPVAPENWHTVAFDCAGPFPEALGTGNKYLIVAVDYFSKWADVKAVPSIKAHDTAGFLQELLDSKGCMSEVITDNGSHFHAEFTELLEQNHIDHNHSRPYHPQGNGLVERTIRTLKGALGKLVTKDVQKAQRWDGEIPSILRGYNWSTQNSTKLSPFYLEFGRHPKIRFGSGNRLRQIRDTLESTRAVLTGSADALSDTLRVPKDVIPLVPPVPVHSLRKGVGAGTSPVIRKAASRTFTEPYVNPSRPLGIALGPPATLSGLIASRRRESNKLAALKSQDRALNLQATVGDKAPETAESEAGAQKALQERDVARAKARESAANNIERAQERQKADYEQRHFKPTVGRKKWTMGSIRGLAAGTEIYVRDHLGKRPAKNGSGGMRLATDVLGPFILHGTKDRTYAYVADSRGQTFEKAWGDICPAYKNGDPPKAGDFPVTATSAYNTQLALEVASAKRPDTPQVSAATPRKRKLAEYREPRLTKAQEARMHKDHYEGRDDCGRFDLHSIPEDLEEAGIL